MVIEPLMLQPAFLPLAPLSFLHGNVLSACLSCCEPSDRAVIQKPISDFFQGWALDPSSHPWSESMSAHRITYMF